MEFLDFRAEYWYSPNTSSGPDESLGSAISFLEGIFQNAGVFWSSTRRSIDFLECMGDPKICEFLCNEVERLKTRLSSILFLLGSVDGWWVSEIGYKKPHEAALQPRGSLPAE